MPEIVWDGKYDSNHKLIVPPKIPLPFQMIETVNESSQDRQRNLFRQSSDAPWRNRLIWGDKKYILPSLLPEFGGKVSLIYIDPPFETGADFSMKIPIGENEFAKEPNMIEEKAYRDTWGVNDEERSRGVTPIDRYLRWFNATAVILRDLLADGGCLFVHLDYHVGHYVKAVLDEVLPGGFRNEIIWQKIRTTKAQSNSFGNVHDVIFFYSKGKVRTFSNEYADLSSDYIKSHYKPDPKTQRLYRTVSLLQKGDGPKRRFGNKLLAPPPGLHWIWSQERIDEAFEAGLIRFTSNGRPEKIQFLDEMQGDIVDDLWTDIYPINSQSLDAVGYPTQKPMGLLDRIIRATTREGDLVLDCFSGSGTTAVAAESLGRRWIASDLSRFAVHTARKRLLEISEVRPFAIYNLGKYERQLWQSAEFRGDATAIQKQYRAFIIELFKAQALNGFTWLHGLKRGRFVHVGAVDAPVSSGDIKQIAIEVRAAIGKTDRSSNKVDVLGWDFAFELNEVAKQQAAQANLDFRFLKIPREVLDRHAQDEGDVKFFELGALDIDVVSRGKTLTLKLQDFVIPVDDIPEDVQRTIKSWHLWIDYWAVDFHYKGDSFHNEWQSFRSRKAPKLNLTTTHTYDEAGTYTVMVKVIDILGNDTSKALKVVVK